MKPALFPILFLAILISSCTQKEPIPKIDLTGTWQFQMDSDDLGESEKWFSKNFSETINLPGSMVENGLGNDITLETEWTGGVRNTKWYKHASYAPYFDSTDIRFPFWLQPEKKYTGAAWYRKKITIPENWEGKPVFLKLERPHWESKIWVNATEVGVQNSLATPHYFDISNFLVIGENSLTIRIDNRTKDIDVGHNSHSVSDHTQSNWNGIVGEISLQSRSSVYFKNVRVFPDVKNKQVEIKAEIDNTTLEEKEIEIEVEAEHKKTAVETPEKHFEFTLAPGGNIVSMTYSLGENALLWDEFNPNVYELLLELRHKKEMDVKRIDFGLRDFKVTGTRFSINGRPVFLRGTLECAIFPLTGYPPTKTDYWTKIYKALQSHGLNHVRFHSWCPPQAAFVAADSMGVYLQVECSSWANQSTRLGSGLPIDNFIWEESKRIVKEYGNHPSFVMMAYGNEPGGPGHKRFLAEFVNYWKENDKRRIYTSAAGWPALPENEYHNLPQPRIQAWGEQLNSIINAEAPKTNYDWSEKTPADNIPVVSHEIGQWCVYPNFKEIEKYTGPLKAKNFELFKESLTANNMGTLAEDFLMASGKLQTLCYKADIEAALRTPGFAGFQLLDLHDFPGQGTALVGVLDPFWEEKGYVSPEEYSRFCNTTVPLARLEKRIFAEGETLNANIEVAHFGEFPIETNPSWKIVQNNEVLAEGTLGNQKIQIGNSIHLGEINYEFQKVNNPRKVNLEVAIDSFTNSWDIWVYPNQNAKISDDIKIVENLNSAGINHLNKGGKLLLSLGKGKVKPEMGGEVGVGFSSIFWNTAWTDGQKPHTLGILCDPQHPALAQFPTEYHSNWQWWDAMSNCDAINLSHLSDELQPIVRIIDDWVTNRPLAMLFEAQVGNGKIIVSGVDLINNIENRPEATQLKKSLLDYMNSDKFNPEVQLLASDIQNILQ